MLGVPTEYTGSQLKGEMSLGTLLFTDRISVIRTCTRAHVLS